MLTFFGARSGARARQTRKFFFFVFPFQEKSFPAVQETAKKIRREGEKEKRRKGEVL